MKTIKEKIFEIDSQHPNAVAYYSLLKTSSWIEAQVKNILKPNNITHAQLNILYILAENHPTPLNAKTIKESLIVSSPDITRLIDKLLIKGYVDRKTCTHNRRKIDITMK